MQMEMEQGFDAAPPPETRADGSSAIANPFLHYEMPHGFVVPSHEMVEGQTSGSGFGGSIPPSVAASVGMQEEFRTLGTNDKLPAKMHIRRPGRDNWSYIGRVNVYQELTHKAPVVVVRLQSNDKIVATFSESSNVSVDKRGNFIVVAAVEPAGVISYSLHAQTNNDALKLLASIELAAYKLGTLTGTENRQQARLRRRIEKTIKDDRRRRHKRKKDDDALVAMLGSASIGTTVP